MKTLKLAAFLALIAALSAGCIAAVYQLTNPIIQQRIALEKEQTIRSFFPTLSSFEEVELSDATYSNLTVLYTVYGPESERLGVVYEGSANGCGGPINILMSYDDQSGFLTNLQYMGSFSETPGFGTRVKEEAFLNQIVGQSPQQMEIETISGATISSTAVKAIIEQANAHVKEVSQ